MRTEHKTLLGLLEEFFGTGGAVQSEIHPSCVVRPRLPPLQHMPCLGRQSPYTNICFRTTSCHCLIATSHAFARACVPVVRRVQTPCSWSCEAVTMLCALTKKDEQIVEDHVEAGDEDEDEGCGEDDPKAE